MTPTIMLALAQQVWRWYHQRRRWNRGLGPGLQDVWITFGILVIGIVLVMIVAEQTGNNAVTGPILMKLFDFLVAVLGLIAYLGIIIVVLAVNGLGEVFVFFKNALQDTDESWVWIDAKEWAVPVFDFLRDFFGSDQKIPIAEEELENLGPFK